MPYSSHTLGLLLLLLSCFENIRQPVLLTPIYLTIDHTPQRFFSPMPLLDAHTESYASHARGGRLLKA
jgi:hypothetical protein